MNRDDVFRLAREAGIHAEPGNSFADDMYLAVLYRFANLVDEAAKRESRAEVERLTAEVERLRAELEQDHDQ